MKNFFKFFTPVIWFMCAVYISNFFIEAMNTPSTFNFSIGILGILLIIYLSIKMRLGTKFFN